MLPSAVANAAEISLLNVSYDPTREFFEDYNEQFARRWQQISGDEVVIRQSHGGSGKQARSVIMGLKADVVTLALAYDVDAIAKAGRIKEGWQDRFENHSVPFTSTIVFMVRKGNPKNIRDWDDLVKPNVVVMTPNPKISGGARWNYLAAWAYALKSSGGNEDQARAFMISLFRNVPMLDGSARAATTSFLIRNMGDVLLSWENEAYIARQLLGEDKFDIVTPSISIKAEPVAAVVDTVVDKKHTRAVAEEYLRYLYSETGQAMAEKHFFRPLIQSDKWADIPMVSVDEMGGWQTVHAAHFVDGGLFDQIFMARR